MTDKKAEDDSDQTSDNNTWTCCSGSRRTDKRLVMYVTQSLFGLLVIGFACGMIANGQQSEIFIPILTGTMSLFLPNPRL
jgi:hypothetical protein